MDARNLPPEKQSVIQMNLKERLEAVKDEIVNKLNLMGGYLKAKLEDRSERLKEACMNLPVEFHRNNFRIGVIYAVPLILILLAEIWLNNWILSPYGLAFEGLLISMVITTVGMLALHLLLNKLKQSNPKLYSRIKTLFIVVSVIFLLLAVPFLSQIRGELTQTQRGSDDLEGIAKKGEDFFEKTSIPLMLAMMFIGLSMCFVAGLTLHEALPRLVISGRVVGIQKEIEALRERLIAIAKEIESWQQLVKLGMIEFKRGLYLGEAADRKFWLAHLSVLFAVFVFGLLSAGRLQARERESLNVLFDVTLSTECRDYSGTPDFQKNVSLVSEIISQANENTYMRIVGITGNSFERPYVIMEGELDAEKGAFGENLARKKMSLIERWNQTKPEANARETDLFGALFFLSMIFQREEGIKKLIIISDFKNSVGVNLEEMPFIDEGVIDQVAEQGLIPDLSGVRVWALTSTCGMSAKYHISLKNFFRQYFERAGAELLCFTVDRTAIKEAFGKKK